MERGKKYCCLVLSGHNEAPTPRLAHNNELEVLQTEDPEEAALIIRNRFIDCIILQTDKEAESVCNNYRVFSVQFPAIPILVILENNHLELACRL